MEQIRGKLWKVKMQMWGNQLGYNYVLWHYKHKFTQIWLWVLRKAKTKWKCEITIFTADLKEKQTSCTREQKCIMFDWGHCLLFLLSDSKDNDLVVDTHCQLEEIQNHVEDKSASIHEELQKMFNWRR